MTQQTLRKWLELAVSKPNLDEPPKK